MMKVFMMKRLLVLLFVFCFTTSGAFAAENFTLSSPQVESGKKILSEQVFNGFGCSGANLSPELEWKGAPANAKSFAVTLYDPDAPTGSGWWHWVMFNIPAGINKLAKGAGNGMDGAPSGAVLSMTDFGATGYGGPCPPQGDNPHRYEFTVYALSTDKLELDSKAPAAMVGFFLNQNLISKAVLKAHFSR